jgi:hypothetical protein
MNQRVTHLQMGSSPRDAQYRDWATEPYGSPVYPDPIAWHRRVRAQSTENAATGHPVRRAATPDTIGRALQLFDEVLRNSFPDFQIDSADFAARRRAALQRKLEQASSRNSQLERENADLRSALKAAHHMEPTSLKRRFQELVDQWREETAHMSSAISFSQHPAYLRIIGMGPAVLPFILEDLARTRSHWFTALSLITGENPIPSADKGKVRKMAEAWITWGRERGLV